MQPIGCSEKGDSNPGPAVNVEVPVIEWKNCYDTKWENWITPEAYKHPAKFAPGLVERIYRHMLENGWLRPDDLVGDPFGGLVYLGFEPVERIHALVISETVRKGFFGEHVVGRRRVRKSFFRKMAEARGAPPIDYEVVLIVKRPE